MLRQGVIQWGGPARCTDDVARVIGYSSSREFYEDQDRLVDLVSSQKCIEDLDFRRLVLATEIVFVSDLLGAGVEWETVSGLSDEETLTMLREMQRESYRFPNSHGNAC
ncbi:hypothetical protein G7068_06340 [Leucobacter viscericola]|uniref:Uncharacterized protein n=1 Tax=Leucobacter viscericola TaxID=2714935 RepID=A0A6G7XE21_9MICO|nr:hypothetical protein [Leucobacter viscericola]QIK62860.1 hypothetical protein G7068_06340 [Leucobacter viscericola]